MLSMTTYPTDEAHESRHSIDLENGDHISQCDPGKSHTMLSRQNCKRSLYAIGATILLITAFGYGTGYLSHSEGCRRRLPGGYERIPSHELESESDEPLSDKEYFKEKMEAELVRKGLSLDDRNKFISEHLSDIEKTYSKDDIKKKYPYRDDFWKGSSQWFNQYPAPENRRTNQLTTKQALIS